MRRRLSRAVVCFTIRAQKIFPGVCSLQFRLQMSKPTLSQRRGFAGKIEMPEELFTMSLTEKGYHPQQREGKTSYSLLNNYHTKIPPKTMVALHTGVFVSKPIKDYVVCVDQSPKMTVRGIITLQTTLEDKPQAIVVHAFNTTDTEEIVCGMQEVGILRVRPKIPFAVNWNGSWVSRRPFWWSPRSRYSSDSDNDSTTTQPSLAGAARKILESVDGEGNLEGEQA